MRFVIFPSLGRRMRNLMPVPVFDVMRYPIEVCFWLTWMHSSAFWHKILPLNFILCKNLTQRQGLNWKFINEDYVARIRFVGTIINFPFWFNKTTLDHGIFSQGTQFNMFCLLTTFIQTMIFINSVNNSYVVFLFWNILQEFFSLCI